MENNEKDFDNLPIGEKRKLAKETMIKKTEQLTKNICGSILSQITYPEVQYSVFKEHFQEQFKEFIQTGKDPYDNPEKKMNIKNLWHFTVGTLNSPVNVVDGEGPDRKVIGTLPPYVAPMRLKSTTKKVKLDHSVDSALEYKDNNNAVYLSKLDKNLSNVMADIKESRIDIKKHGEDWLEAIKNIENKDGHETTKPKTKKEDSKTGTVFEW